MKGVKVLTGLGLVAIGTYIVVSSLRLDRFGCEVCVEFGGEEVCRTAWGPSEEEAIRAAQENACAQLTRSRAESVRCSMTPPSRVDCGVAER